MDKIHILVTAPFIEDGLLDRIAVISPRLEIYNARDAVFAELGIEPHTGLPVNYPSARKIESAQALGLALAKTDIIFGLHLPMNLLSRAPSLKWIQGIGVGIDRVAANPGILQSEILVTNSHVNRYVVAEYAFYLMIALAKKAPLLFTNQQSHQWEILDVVELRGKTVGIVGLGYIGSRISSLARAFGMKVLATRKSVTSREQNTNGVDEVFPLHELHSMLKECDFLILAAPLTSETIGLIGEKELRLMKRTSSIINVARGQIIQQTALIQALKEGWIFGAGLDVFETEPLPPDSELWNLPNVIISPHLARITQDEVPEVIELFCDNLKRFLDGEKLVNLVDKGKGY